MNTEESPEEQKRVPYQRDYGDDIEDYERKRDKEWNQEYQNNPIYQQYRTLRHRR